MNLYYSMLKFIKIKRFMKELLYNRIVLHVKLYYIREFLLKHRLPDHIIFFLTTEKIIEKRIT